MEQLRATTVPVAIVGAGVAGLALAALLTRLGVGCQVFERTRRLGAVGAGIQLAPNGVRVLQRLNLGDARSHHGVEASRIETRRWDDASLLSCIPLAEQAWDRYAAPYYLLHRADLQVCLQSQVPAEWLCLGRACESITEYDDHVELGFSDSSRVRASLVVGADGAASMVCAALLGDELLYSGYAVYRGLVPSVRMPGFAERRTVMFWLGPDRHVTYYPISSQKTIHFSAVVKAASPPAGTGGGTPARPDELLESFAGWHDEVVTVLSATRTIARWGLFDRALPPSFGSRRIVLVGDAAHLMLPYLSQGANQALEDVAVLADLVAEYSSTHNEIDTVAVVHQYDRLRRPRLVDVHQRCRERGHHFHLGDGAEQRRRDAFLRQNQELASFDWLYAPKLVTAEQE